ncbi:MAG: hypothetical protein LUH14_02235 [Clostridiaceae bacterium]|nr:hypothetical protein [Clostridiaceae bacterium]
MKKWKQVLGLCVLAACLSFSQKIDSRAAQITGFTQTADSSSSVSFSWTADLTAGCYLVESSADAITWVTEGYTTSPSKTIYSLSAGTSYYVRVTPCDSDKKALDTASDAFEVVTSPDGSNISAVQTDATTSSITIKIGTVSGANYYLLTSTDSGSEVAIGASATNEVQVSTALSAGTSYYIRAYACRLSASGYLAGSYYCGGSYKTLSQKINTSKFGLSSAYESSNIFYFKANAGSSFDGYQWQFQTAAGKTKKKVATTSSYLRLADFIEGTFYKYRVRTYVTCDSGNVYSAWSGYKYIGIPKNISVKYDRYDIRIVAKWSAISGSTGCDVFLSTKKDSGYKKIKTVTNKKRSITVTKYNKKKLKKGKVYYLKIVPKAKIGGKSVSSATYYIFNTSTAVY